MPEQIETIRFKNDASKRKRLFVPEAFAHPAKGHISLWEEMVLRYSKEGDTVLDPLAGIGTSLIAALMGRNIICVELESHFVEPMRRSWEKMRNIPMLGYTIGEALILQGDARHLPLRMADCVMTSPPYEASSIADARHLYFDDKRREASITDKRARGLPTGYTRPQVDAVVTSPPFGKQDSSAHRGQLDEMIQTLGKAYRDGTDHNTAENIGNLRSAAYWESMRQVYAECYRILKPGGILALVLKGFTRDGKYVDLPGQTEALLLASGWTKHDHWRRQLWTLSFWRILQKRRDPEAFDDRLNFEEVLAFRKPEGQGDGVDTVLTSPPFETQVPFQDPTWLNEHRQELGQGGWAKTLAGYTRPVDAIISSPPYEASLHEGQAGPGATTDAKAWTEGREKTRGSYTGG